MHVDAPEVGWEFSQFLIEQPGEQADSHPWWLLALQGWEVEQLLLLSCRFPLLARFWLFPFSHLFLLKPEQSFAQWLLAIIMNGHSMDQPFSSPVVG
jgi:hypothetical protein